MHREILGQIGASLVVVGMWISTFAVVPLAVSG